MSSSLCLPPDVAGCFKQISTFKKDLDSGFCPTTALLELAKSRNELDGILLCAGAAR